MISEHPNPQGSQAATVETLELVARGMCSDLYALPQNRILKLLHKRFARELAERELAITRALHASGVPTAAAYELREMDSRFGIVLERIDGRSLLQVVERKPWKLFYAARLLADLHAGVHQHLAPQCLPTQRSQCERWFANARDFTPEQRTSALASLAQLPEGNTLCHGDMHPANILLSSGGPVIIDWSAATRGHALVDVARTCVLFESAKLPPESPVYMHLLLAVSRRLLHRTYLRRYLELTGATLSDITKFLPIQRAAGSAWRAGQDLTR
jgi:aminoglycoside phosphotransferase (APT) family kinase protein